MLVVTGTAGIGKSTVCARLAGTVPGAVFLDADIFAEGMVSVVPPNEDYRAFWRSMTRLAHELAQNDVVVVYFSTMLPEQVLANDELLAYFESIHFLCLACSTEALHARLARRDGSHAATARVQFWSDFNSALSAAARDIPTATVLDVDRSLDEVERDVRTWVESHLHRRQAETAG